MSEQAKSTAQNRKTNLTFGKLPVKKAPVDPNKHTMNFVRLKRPFDFRKMLPVLLILLLALGIFVKVGILDQLARKSLAYSELAIRQEQLAQIHTRLAGYEELQQQYSRYSYGLMNETEINLVSRMDVLSLVEQKIANRAAIENLAVNNNVLTMNIRGITLKEASSMVKSLESSELVTRAAVNSATAEDGIEARIFISITLTKEPAEEKSYED